MTKVYQTITGNKYANCLQACVASYFDLKLCKVPNFMLSTSYSWEALFWFVRSRSLFVDFVKGLPKSDDNYYIVSIDYGANYNHAVIYKNGMIVHDPYIDALCQADRQADINKIDGYYEFR